MGYWSLENNVSSFFYLKYMKMDFSHAHGRLTLTKNTSDSLFRPDSIKNSNHVSLQINKKIRFLGMRFQHD